MDDDRLPGGWMSGARLVDGTVHRPLGAHSPFVHRLLRHLETVGFDGAPRPLGVDGDEEVLTHLDGHVPVETEPDRIDPIVFSDTGIRTAFTLIRRYHDLTAGTDLAAGHEIVCHGDLSPWNTVYDRSGAWGLIDWDGAAPGTRAEDVGYAVWRHLMLGFPGAPPIERQRRWLGLVAAAYGSWDATSLIGLVAEAQVRQHRHVVERRDTGDARYVRLIDLGALDVIEQSQSWLAANADRLAGSPRPPSSV